MGCCPCFGGGRKEKKDGSSSNVGSNNGDNGHKKHENATESPAPAANGNIQGQNFTFRELASATNNFTPDCLLGEGGFGRVYKGCLEKSGEIVAVKQLDRNSLQGNKEFVVEVLMLSLLHHPNLVNLVGYCADGDQRLLVYEFMSNGSLQDHLLELKPNQKPLSWYTRMRIAFGAAQGLEYLHDKANPPVIFCDLKSSNILLDENLNPKLSDFGLAKLGLKGDKPVVSSSIMGTYGYCAPEYARSGEVTMKLDVYSFGVVLLELITGRRAIDTTKPTDEQNLVSWAQPMLRDQKRYPELADPILQGNFPVKGLNQAVAIVAMCLQEEPSVRPIMADVVMTLGFLIDAPPALQPIPSPEQTPQSFVHSNSVRSESSDEHVVETLQLGLRSHESKPGNRSSSNSSSRSSNSSSKAHEEEYRDGSLRLKNSQQPRKYGTRRFSSSKHSERSSDDGSRSSDSDHESEGLISGRSDHEYESD